ncbi:MAG TPA: universal stress protein [Cyclobacteriaceae bacterium]|nr:universal stress protein [Cyclobacteriaceae bacterium]
MKKILVPCDFSYTSKQAYTFALDLAKKTDAEVYVLKVIDIPFMYEAYSTAPPAYLNPEVWKQLETENRDMFNKMKSEHGRQSEITFRIEEGPVTDTIIKFIEREEIDMVVMGTKGSTGLDEYLVGSNTEKIVRFSKVPVFAIRKMVNLSSIRNIVFPTTLKIKDTTFIERLKALQEMLDATLHVLSVNIPTNMNRVKFEESELGDFARKYGLKNCTFNVMYDANEEQGIVSFADKIHADMIALGTHGRRGLAHLFAGSVAEDLVNHVSCPIWTCRL